MGFFSALDLARLVNMLCHWLGFFFFFFSPREIKAKLLQWLSRRIQRGKCGLNGIGADHAAGLWD